MSIYEQLGVRPLINAVGPATRIGGMRLDPEVLTAMREASQDFVRIDELQEAAGRVIAEATGAEAGYVTAGAAAGVMLATAACMTGTDPVLINRLPEREGMPYEVVIQRTQRYDYDHAVRAAGATLVEVGYPDLVFGYEVEAAINERTAAGLYFPVHTRPEVPLEEFVAIAHRHGVPVIVDAALEVPPVENLRAFIAAGADVVVFSGGKAIAGPQASGIVCGRADLIRAIALHHQDMDVRPQTWTYRHLIETGILAGPPHHGIGRALKVGKEEIAGLVVALQRYLGRDHAADQQRWRSTLDRIAGELEPGDGVRTEFRSGRGTVPTLAVHLDRETVGRSAYAILAELQDGDPRIFVNEEQAWQETLVINPIALRDGEDELVARALALVLQPAKRRTHATTY